MTGVFLSVPRCDWCAPLPHPSSCMLVNHGPSQQSLREEYKSWKWGATARYYASHTKTVLPMRKSVPRSSRQSDHTKTPWPSERDTNCSGIDMSPVHQVWPKPSCKAQWKGEGDKADRRRSGKTTSGNGQAWSLPSPKGQQGTEEPRKLVVKSSVVPCSQGIAGGGCCIWQEGDACRRKRCGDCSAVTFHCTPLYDFWYWTQKNPTLLERIKITLGVYVTLWERAGTAAGEVRQPFSRNSFTVLISDTSHSET